MCVMFVCFFKWFIDLSQLWVAHKKVLQQKSKSTIRNLLHFFAAGTIEFNGWIKYGTTCPETNKMEKLKLTSIFEKKWYEKPRE